MDADTPHIYRDQFTAEGRKPALREVLLHQQGKPNRINDPYGSRGSIRSRVGTILDPERTKGLRGKLNASFDLAHEILPGNVAPDLIKLLADKYVINGMPLPINDKYKFAGRIGLGGVSSVYHLESKSNPQDAKVLKVVQAFDSDFIGPYARPLLFDTFVRKTDGIPQLARIADTLREEKEWLTSKFPEIPNIFHPEDYLVMADPLDRTSPRLAIIQQYYPNLTDVFDLSHGDIYSMPPNTRHDVRNLFIGMLDLNREGVSPDIIGRDNIAFTTAEAGSPELVYPDPHSIFVVDKMNKEARDLLDYRLHYMQTYLDNEPE